MGKFNLIGFNFLKGEVTQYKHCVIHEGSRLIQSIEDPTVLLCPECGTNYLAQDTASDERINSMFGPGSNQTKIIQGKKQKKYYDDSGNEITDETLIQDVKRGAHVISYQEIKQGEDKTVIKKRN